MFYETIHLEITNRCNAYCPQCYRTENGAWPYKNLTLQELNLEDVKKMLSEENIKSLKRFYISGSYGDPIIARDTIKIFKWLRNINPNITLGMCTNGSARNSDWWLELGNLLSKEDDFCQFSIDGYMDTFHYAKRGTNIQTVLNNAKIFIANNGRAIWSYLAFKNNEEEIEDAQKESIRLGFQNFILKRSVRFNENSITPVIDRKGNFVYNIEPPTNQNIPKADTSEIDEIYISYNGYAWPNQHLGTLFLLPVMTEEKTKLLNNIENNGNIDDLNLFSNSLEKVINSNLFLKLKNMDYS